MGIEDLGKLFAYSGRGAGNDEDLLLQLGRAGGGESAEGPATYLASLVREVLLSKLGLWRESLAELITHCCSLVDLRRVEDNGRG